MVSLVHSELMNLIFCWSANPGMSISQSPQENIAYLFIFTSSAMPNMDGLLDGR